MSHLSEIIKSSSYRLGANLATTVIAISFMAYFARAFTKEQMALYATLTILSAWNDILGGLGLGTLVIKEAATLVAAGKTERVQSLISSVVAYRTIALFLLCLVWTAFSLWFDLGVFSSAEFKGVITVVIWTSFIASCISTVGHIQISVQKFLSREVINVVTVLGQRILCVIGFVVAGLQGFYWGLLLASGVGLLLGIFDIRKFLVVQLIPLSEIFRESKKYLGLELLRSGLDHLDRPVIALFMGAEALAGFHVAKRLYDIFYSLILAIVVPAGVKFGELRTSERGTLQQYYRNCMIGMAQAFIPLGFFLMVVSTPLLFLYGGEKYLSSAPVVMAFGFTFIGVALWTILREAALRLLSPKYLAYQYSLSTLVTLICYLLLLPPLGLIGIPVAMGLGYFLGLIPLVSALNTSWEMTVPIRYFALAVGAGLCVAATALPLLLIEGYLLQLSVATILSIAVYIIWLLLAGPAEGRDLLRQLWRYLGHRDFAKFARNSAAKSPCE